MARSRFRRDLEDVASTARGGRDVRTSCSTRRGPAWRTRLAYVAGALALLGSGLAGVPQAGASGGPVTVSITSTPGTVVTGQAVAFRVNVANTGAAPATGVTLSELLSGVGVGQM